MSGAGGAGDLSDCSPLGIEFHFHTVLFQQPFIYIIYHCVVIYLNGAYYAE